MDNQSLRKAWPLLKRQVRELNVPWLEKMARLHSSDPFRILISCILSFRTQDRTTGDASERLFRLASHPEDMAELGIREIERAIYPVGFYRVKARRIRELSRVIVERYNGRVPDKLDELLRLKGVGRKTANLVITLGYRGDGICVDTHVHRITNRWGYVKTETPEETEFALRKKLPRRYWREINGLLVAFGQGICKPLSPFCSRCRISMYCDKVGVRRHR
jgi:endonuclease-3